MRLSLLAMTLGVGACHATTLIIPIPKSDGQLQGNPEVVTVTRRDGTALTVYLPVIARDSLIAWLDRPTADQPPTSRVAISLGDVRQINSTKLQRSAMGSIGGAFAMVALGSAVLIGLLLIAFFSSSEIGK